MSSVGSGSRRSLDGTRFLWLAFVSDARITVAIEIFRANAHVLDAVHPFRRAVRFAGLITLVRVAAGAV